MKITLLIPERKFQVQVGTTVALHDIQLKETYFYYTGSPQETLGETKISFSRKIYLSIYFL